MRYPYSYVPQEPVPAEVPIERIDNVTYRVPGAGAFGAKTVIDVEGTLPYYQDVALCVATDDEEDLSQREKVFEVDTPVSYTHLDVYKRQPLVWAADQGIFWCARRAHVLTGESPEFAR